MFALRRLSSLSSAHPIRLSAALSTVSTSSGPTAPPPVPSASTSSPEEGQSTPTNGRRKRTTKPGQQWHRELPFSVVPAYDLALDYLKQDSQALKQELQGYRKTIDEMQASYQALSDRVASLLGDGDERAAVLAEMRALNEELEKVLEKANIIEVQSEINLPNVRWKARNHLVGDRSKLSHRYLLEQRWRKDGDLDLLMERIYQMGVVPDVLPIIKPSLDLHLTRATKSGKVARNIEPGVFLPSYQTLEPPVLSATVFHTDVRLYTMLLVDLDVPNTETARYTTFLHWMKPNIPLSATTPSPSRIPHLNKHTKYIPPHPQRGTPYHRYVCLLLPQAPLVKDGYTLAAISRAGVEPTSVYLDIPVVPDSERFGFDVRAFAEKWNLDGAQGGGAHMWRGIWDKYVSNIYQDILKQPEPHYGQPPKEDVYAQVKQEKKYHL